jgi:hypothetical protein
MDVSGITVGLELINLDLINLSCQDHIVLRQANLPQIDALHVYRDMNFLVWLVSPIEEGRFTTTALHVSFTDQELVKIEWVGVMPQSPNSSDPLYTLSEPHIPPSHLCFHPRFV